MLHCNPCGNALASMCLLPPPEPLPYDELSDIAKVAWPIPLRPHEGLDGIPRFLLTFRGEVRGGSRCQHIPSQVKVLIVTAERLGLDMCGHPHVGELLQQRGRIRQRARADAGDRRRRGKASWGFV